jgi:hypothetical protein
LRGICLWFFRFSTDFQTKGWCHFPNPPIIYLSLFKIILRTKFTKIFSIEFQKHQAKRPIFSGGRRRYIFILNQK